jgi:hypothetical protein
VLNHEDKVQSSETGFSQSIAYDEVCLQWNYTLKTFQIEQEAKVHTVLLPILIFLKLYSFFSSCNSFYLLLLTWSVSAYLCYVFIFLPNFEVPQS